MIMKKGKEMNELSPYRSRLEEGNRKEYAERYLSLKWLTEKQALEAAGTREEILSFLNIHAAFGYQGTKVDCTRLSPGCKICGDGSWSCLFINGKCNCSCFYCPTRQDDIGLPTTNRVVFPRPGDYLDYLERFNFKGVGVSGGEPLLTPDTTIAYISAVKKRFGDHLYVWMYTNGTLAKKDMILKLSDAGLDEIRFDIGATGYSLEPASEAVGHIGHVTVEIPAIPEDFEIMKRKIPEMHERGVDFLNLHQLRLTPHNYSRLAGRNYTYLHGEKVTVLESETAALNLIRYVHENRLVLPVNYCSFVYKNRFQKAAARKRSAEHIAKPYEDITKNGYIRSLCISGKADDIRTQIKRFRLSGSDEKLWSVNAPGDRLNFSRHLWGLIDFTGLHLSVGYHEALILPALTYQNPFREIQLNKDRKVVVEKIRSGPQFELSGGELSVFEEIAFNSSTVPACSITGHIEEICRHEHIPSGLQEYF